LHLTSSEVAGLQLAGLAQQQQHDRASFIEAFANSSHPIVNYLAEEVLQNLPGDVLQFLLHTSLLDQLSASFC
jgi:ATP/maltotriose-dependent transcriptional regulator MalT